MPRSLLTLVRRKGIKEGEKKVRKGYNGEKFPGHQLYCGAGKMAYLYIQNTD